jgi:hypothetical protein
MRLEIFEICKVKATEVLDFMRICSLIIISEKSRGTPNLLNCLGLVSVNGIQPSEKLIYDLLLAFL